MPIRYVNNCCENKCTEVKYACAPITLCNIKNEQNMLIASGIWALVLAYDAKKSPIRLTSTIMFAIEIEDNIAATGSITQNDLLQIYSNFQIHTNFYKKIFGMFVFVILIS